MSVVWQFDDDQAGQESEPLLTWGYVADLLDAVRGETWEEAELEFTQRYGELVSDRRWYVRERLRQLDHDDTPPDFRPRWRRRVA